MMNTFIRLLIVTGAFMPLFCWGQAAQDLPKDDDNNLLCKLLEHDHSPVIQKVINNPGKYRLQINYTPIDRLTRTHTKLNTLRLFPQDGAFAYPASMVKLPVCMMTLSKLHSLAKYKVDKNSRMISDAAKGCQICQERDYNSPDSFPSLSLYIRKMLLVSDNVAYNRAYEFLGPDDISSMLRKADYPDVRIMQRFYTCDTLQNRQMNPITFLNSKGEQLYFRDSFTSSVQLRNPLGKSEVGSGFMNAKKQFKPPLSFEFSNNLPLIDVHNMLINLVMGKGSQFGISESDRDFMLKYMAMYPGESEIQAYHNRQTYFPAYKKYLIYGRDSKAKIDSNVRIYNIVGWGYGHVSDCAYITDKKSGAEFFLSAQLYCNEDGILNDDKYEYATIGFPFLKRLGEIILDYERSKR